MLNKKNVYAFLTKIYWTWLQTTRFLATVKQLTFTWFLRIPPCPVHEDRTFWMPPLLNATFCTDYQFVQSESGLFNVKGQN